MNMYQLRIKHGSLFFTGLTASLLGVDVVLERLHLLPGRRLLVVLDGPVHVVRRRPKEHQPAVHVQSSMHLSHDAAAGRRPAAIEERSIGERRRRYLPCGEQGDLPREHVFPEQPHAAPPALCTCDL